MRHKDFDRLVEEALRKIPRIFRDAMKNIEIVVDDWPDPEITEEDLYGLFTGTPLPEQSFDQWGEPPALIHIFQGPLEADFPDRNELVRQIEITLAHEIAHYLGFDEQTLHSYGYD